MNTDHDYSDVKLNYQTQMDNSTMNFNLKSSDVNADIITTTNASGLDAKTHLE